MKFIIVVLFGFSILNANKVYDISLEDYNLYNQDKEKMLNVFKERFLKMENNSINTSKNKVDIEKIALKEKLKKLEDEKKLENKKKLEKLANYKKIEEKNKLEKLKNDKKLEDEKKEENLKLQKLLKLNNDLKNENIKLENKINKKEVEQIKYKNFDDKFKSVFDSNTTVSVITVENTRVIKKDLNTSIKYNSSNIKSYIKMNKIYNEKELLVNLTIENITEDENNIVFLRSIDKVLLEKNIQYEKNEIKEILDLIKRKKITNFEANIYLNQIKELIKG